MNPKVVCSGVRMADETIAHAEGCPGTITEGDPERLSHGLWKGGPAGGCHELTLVTWAKTRVRARSAA